MYPQGELTRLAALKAGLRERIGARRNECAAAAQVALRPLVWVDRARDLWRRFSPLAKTALLPLGLALWRHRPATPRWPATLLRWAPAVLQLLQILPLRRSRPPP
jgi:hypothetical protein